METTTPQFRRMLPMFAFVLVSTVLTVVAWKAFGGSLPLEPHGYRVDVTLPHATNLNPQADVRIAGVNVGEVTDVERDGNAARVTIELESDYAPLRSDARAILRSKTLLGEGYLEISPGSADAEPIPEDGELASDRTEPAQQLDDVLQTFAPRTRERLRGLFAGLADSFGGREAELSSSLGRLAPVTADLGDVADTLARQRGDLRTLLGDAGQVFAVLGEQQGAMQAAIRSGNEVFKVTADRDRELAATVEALVPFLHSMEDSFTRLGDASGDLNGAVAGLRPVVSRLRPALKAMSAGGPAFRRFFDNVPSLVAGGKAGLPALAGILKVAPPALGALYADTRELIPVLQLLKLVKDSVTLTLANVGQIHGGYAVGPGNEVVNYVPGVITAWNETIGGWTKQLPTHRGNSYPAPGFLDDIGRYQSFDCRNTRNILDVPPLLATPPCRQQQPWTFNGKTAYYPRLQRDPP